MRASQILQDGGRQRRKRARGAKQRRKGTHLRRGRSAMKSRTCETWLKGSSSALYVLYEPALGCAARRDGAASGSVPPWDRKGIVSLPRLLPPLGEMAGTHSDHPQCRSGPKVVAAVEGRGVAGLRAQLRDDGRAVLWQRTLLALCARCRGAGRPADPVGRALRLPDERLARRR